MPLGSHRNVHIADREVAPATRRRARVAWLHVLAALAALGGCSRNDDVVARIGQDRITGWELERAVRQAACADPNAPPVEPQALLRTLVAQRLLLAAGRDLGTRGELEPGPAQDHPARGGVAARDDRLLRAVYRIEVEARISEPSTEDLRAEFERTPASPRLEHARIATILVRDSSQKNAMMRLLRETRRLRAAARALEPPLVASERDLRFPSQDRLWGPRERMLASMRPHQIRGPIAIAGGWLWVEMIELRLRSASFDALSDDDRHRLRGAWMERAAAERFNTLMDSLTAVFRPEMDLERAAGIGRHDRDANRGSNVAMGVALAAFLLAGLRLGSDASAGHPRTSARWRALAVAVLAVVLVVLGVRYAARGATDGWDLDNVLRAAREMRAGLSPYEPATIRADGWDPATPYLYAPSTLWLFRPLVEIPAERARELWFALQLAMAVGLGIIARNLLGRRVTTLELVAVMLFGFNGALLMSIRVANVATLECLMIWAAFLALQRGRHWPAAGLLALAAQFKLAPIVFLVLLFRRPGGLLARAAAPLAGAGLFATLLVLPGLLHLPWASGYLHNLETTRPFGEVNPSVLGLVDMVRAHSGASAGEGRGPLVLWGVFDLALLALSAPTLRRVWRGGGLDELLPVAAVMFVLLSPRPILYGYALALIPSLWLVVRLWPTGPARSSAVLLLASQGLFMRGTLQLDFLGELLPWPMTVLLSNLQWLTLLALWATFLHRDRGGWETEARGVVAFRA